MKKALFKQLLLEKIDSAQADLRKKFERTSNIRFINKQYVEGYKFGLSEIIGMVDTFKGDNINDDFMKSMEHRG